LKYLTKPPKQVTHSLALFHDAPRTVNEHPATAEDTGTDIRTAQHFMTRVNNQLSGTVEISASMAAAAILGMPAETSSDSFFLVFVNAAVKYALAEQQQPNDASTDYDDTYCVDSDFADIHQQSIPTIVLDTENVYDTEHITDGEEEDNTLLDDICDQEADTHIDREDSADIGAEDGTAPVYAGVASPLAVPQHIHYAFRGNQLYEYSLYEYAALILLSRIIQNNITNMTGNDHS